MSRDGEHDCVTIHAQTKANQKLDVYVTKGEDVRSVVKDLDNNTKIELQQTTDIACDVDIMVKESQQASVQGNSRELTFKMLTTSAQSDFNINPITCLLYTSPSPRDS